MKKIVFAFCLAALFPLSAMAVELRIIGKGGETLLDGAYEATFPTTVGELTVRALEAAKVDYQGGSSGISAMFGLGQDIDVISDSEMKAYGWCFAVDGVVPESMADETMLPSAGSRVEWFYAFAHYRAGAWIGQCVRASN